MSNLTSKHIQDAAKADAAMIDVNSEISNIIKLEVEQKVAGRYRPVIMWQALMDHFGDEFASKPIVNSGPKGTNNPDLYVIKTTKAGNEKYGSYWKDFASDLPVCEDWKYYLSRLEAASKTDAPADDDIQAYKSKGAKWIEAEKRNVNEKIRAATELVITGVQIEQMVNVLSEFDTIEVNLVMTRDGDGNEVLDERTARPFHIKERYQKRGQDGQPLEDTEGNPVYVYTDKNRYLSVGELIGLAPHEAEDMPGGFSFDNLFKAAAHKREREKIAQGKQSSVKNAEQFISAIDNVRLYITGDGYEKKIQRLIDMARKDESVLSSIGEMAIAFDVLWENLSSDFNAMKQKKREAKNGKAATAA